MPEHGHHRTPSLPRWASFPWWVGCLVVVLLIVAAMLRGQGDGREVSGDEPSLATAAEPGAQSSASGFRFATTIRRPSGPPTIELQQADPQGRRGSVACSTCHSVREPNYSTRVPADLDQFHQQMPMDHGKLACYACHHPGDADALRLADSTRVEYADVMTLCSQCHGTQARDYQHGAHGGMNGYWDLSRGPRTRNNCIDCHDPHVPKFPTMHPTFKPRDRFLEPHASVSRRALSFGEVDGE